MFEIQVKERKMKIQKKLLSRSIVIITILLLSTNLWAGNIMKGKEKAKLCEGCHGVNGISVSSIIPNLAGQKEEYLSLSLHAFKNGSRKNGIMSSITTQISSDDINDLSAYYSGLSIVANEKQ